MRLNGISLSFMYDLPEPRILTWDRLSLATSLMTVVFPIREVFSVCSAIAPQLHCGFLQVDLAQMKKFTFSIAKQITQDKVPGQIFLIY